MIVLMVVIAVDRPDRKDQLVSLCIGIGSEKPTIWFHEAFFDCMCLTTQARYE
jgi:hypothetical protein